MSPKILIIDDERPTLAMFRLLLNAMGYDVITAEDGTRGLDLIRTMSPQIVISDIKMPGIDGLSVLERIKALNANVEIILMTGHGDEALEQEALDLNATAFLHKPVDKAALEKALEKARSNLDQGPAV